jgi:vacuolar-type H+-ATPase subunit F/Vma7
MIGGTVAVIGEQAQVRGYALAGAVVIAAEGEDAVHRAWASLDDQTTLVIVTKKAAVHLTDELTADWPLTVVMPP